MTFYYSFYQNDFSGFSSGGNVEIGNGLNQISYVEEYHLSQCYISSVDAVFAATKGSSEIVLNNSIGNAFLKFNINRIEDKGDRNLNVKLSPSSSLNIATKKGNQTLKMFSMSGQLVYSYSFNTSDWADVNVSLPENIFSSGIYILSLVSETEAKNYKVFIP